MNIFPLEPFLRPLSENPWTYLVFGLIGFGFGFVLELSGFGNSKKLAAQFYFRDLTVLKVMFGAIVTAMVLLVLPVSRSLKWLNVTCVLAIVGIWIEKGMGLVIPGFIPTPLGAIEEYSPSLNETLVCLGIWAFGLLCYTVFLRMSVPILQGRLSKANEGQPDAEGASLALTAAPPH